MELIRTQSITPFHRLQIFRLWNSEYPAQLAYSNMEGLETYLNGLDRATHYILSKDECLLSWAVAFDRGSERWFAIIVDSTSQKKGYGSLLLKKLKTEESSLCGWVTDHEKYVRYDGTPYPSPLKFYLKNGFKVVTDVRFENEKLSAVKILWQRDS